MITTISILENGSFSPNRVLQLGNKYDNLDNNFIDFIVPSRYMDYNYYVFLKNGKHEFVLPINKVYEDSSYHNRFYVGSTITQYAGTWAIVFIASESEISNINNSKNLMSNVLTSERFISNIISGYVADNALSNPVVGDLEDSNLQVKYQELDDLIRMVQEGYNDGLLDGPYYIPNVDAEGNLTWQGSRIEPPMEEITSMNITGPKGDKGEKGDVGGYYIPKIENDVLEWSKSSEEMPEVENCDLGVKIEDSAKRAVEDEFQYIWDDSKEALYIYSKNGEGSNVEDAILTITNECKDYVDTKVQELNNRIDAEVEQLSDEIRQLWEYINNSNN